MGGVTHPDGARVRLPVGQFFQRIVTSCSRRILPAWRQPYAVVL